MLLSATCISAFANNPKDTPMPITGVLNTQIHKIFTYTINYGSHNGVCRLTFMGTFDNAEIRIYQNGILIDQNSGSFAEGETYTLDFQGYGKGEYTIEVYCGGNKIFSSSEEI